jgi:glucuronoarabinoxylan endo-1,4-beta-xylanase
MKGGKKQLTVLASARVLIMIMVITMLLASQALNVTIAIAENATVNVDGSVKYQTISGFGGAGAFYQNYLDGLQEPARTEVANLLFTDLGTSIYRLRVWTGIEPSNGTFNFNTDPDQVWTATQAKERGVTQFMASVWTPPAWMKSNGQETNGGYLLPSMYQAFANYLAAYVKGYQQYHNITISYISIQNEPEMSTPYQSCLYTAAQMRDVVKVVGATFAAQNITTQILIPETACVSNAPGYISTIMSDPNASKYVDVFASHIYDIPFLNPNAGISSLQTVAKLSTQYNKPIWQTEYCNLSANANTFQEALCTAEQINNVLTYMNGSAYLVWGLFWPQDGTGQGLITIPSYGASTYTVTPKFYAVKQYFKFIRPGSKRIEAASNNTNVLVSAYVNEANGNVTIVAINSGSSSITTTFNLENVSSTYFKQYQTSASENCAYIGSIAVSSNSFTATLPPQSITTFTGNYPSGPTAKFTFSPSVAPVNETVTFDASTSLPGWNGTNEMPIVNYKWDFGDGAKNTTTNSIVTHKYMVNGTYTVTLNVTDSQGLWNNTSKAIKALWHVHNIAIIYMSPFATGAYPTWLFPMQINVTVKNYGTFTETFPVTLYWNNSGFVETHNVTLAIEETVNVTFNWTIPSIPKAHSYPYPIYILSANATLPGNVNSGILIGGSVTVKWPGDANGDGHVNGFDLYIMAVSWHQSKGSAHYDPRADFNGDGHVDGFDLYWLAVNWHRGPLD